jgi:BCD family chlorophyll transporter-like MFS transporter
MSTTSVHLGWAGIVRLGLVQTALGAIVVLTTTAMNRIMVVELALPAMVPGLLVGLHHALQLLRPRLGHGSDVGGRRTPWIVGGMALLAAGGFTAGLATGWMVTNKTAGLVLALLAFTLIGVGVGAAGTSLLVLLAKRVHPDRRAAAATIVWVMMIAGFAITAGIAGHLLDPYSPARLVAVSAGVAGIAFLVTLVAVYGVERGGEPATTQAHPPRGTASFREALAQVWEDHQARRFTVFVFLSMLAYSLQDLILEPFAGTVFGFTPGESTKLGGLQHGGVMAGMIAMALSGSLLRVARANHLRVWTVAGCLVSAGALFGLAAAAHFGPAWPLRATVFALGSANGAFAVAAIGSMMSLAGAGGAGREGVRMGVWGAAQAIAFGAGGFLGTAASDVARWLLGSPVSAYSSVFAIEATMFLASAWLATRITVTTPALRARPPSPSATPLPAP